MSARTTLRALVTGLLAGEVFDLGVSGDFKIIPIQDNTHTLQLGNETHTLGLKVYLGVDVNTYFELTPGPPAALNLPNVSFSLANVVANDVVANTLTVSGNTSVGTNTVVTGNTVATGALSGSHVIGGPGITLGDTTLVNITVAGNTVADTLITNTLTANTTIFDGVSTNILTVTSNTITATWDATGITSVQAIPLVPTMTLNTLTVVPVVDDGTATVFGADVKSSDFQVFLGGASTYSLFDRGATAWELSGVTFHMDDLFFVSNNLTSNSLVTSADLSGDDLTVTNAMVVPGDTNLTGTTAATTITAESLTLIPAVDDTASLTLGNSSQSVDVLVTMGTPYARFDRGATQLVIRGLELNTNTTVIGTSLQAVEVNATAINVVDITVGNSIALTGNIHIDKTFKHVTSNTILTEADSGKIITNQSAGGSINISLPDISTVANTVNYEVMTLASQDIVLDSFRRVSTEYTAANKEHLYRGSSPIATYPFSCEFWVKQDGTNPAIGYLFNLQSSGNLGSYMCFRVGGGSSTMQLVARDAVGTVELSSIGGTVNCVDNEWHHIIGIWGSATGRRLWIDGGTDDVTSNTNVTVNATYNRLNFGAFYQSDTTAKDYYTGGCSGLAFYNGALNSAQRTWLWNSGSGRGFRDRKINSGVANSAWSLLTGYWKMDETSGARVDSKNSNDFTDKNTVVLNSSTGGVEEIGVNRLMSANGGLNDDTYTINTVIGHGRLLPAIEAGRWIFAPFGGTLYGIT